MVWPKNYLIIQIFVLALLCGCQNQPPEQEKESAQAKAPQVPPLFTLLSADQTNIKFNNQLTEGLNTNVMAYEYFYNGGGVAIGDVNNDGWEDVYFTGNMSPNKLYLNKSKTDSAFVFEDITQKAGVVGREGPWATGVTMVDVNADGRLDIYVCYSGNLSPENRTNQLFINQGVDDAGIPKFEEMAAEYGLASPATSTQAVFFDYDRDGDLDMFLLNHSPVPLPVLDDANTVEILKIEDPEHGVRLYKNDPKSNGKPFFKDVTPQAGISSTALTYGLGVGVADINGDNWPDIYISNDYSIPDFLYINNGDGTFTDKIGEQLGHTSHFSMGNDVADMNNDTHPDVYTLDMLPEDNRRQKLLFAPDNYELFNFNVRVGFHHQYMRNMLQINNGNGEFSEIGQVAGISNTDWSWAALFADYDNDGWKDLFITNGYVRDYTNMDFIKFMGDFVQRKQGKIKREDVLNLVYEMPASNVTNYIFKNNGSRNAVSFSDVSATWGMKTPSNSNGAAFADLDHDGDLDLVVNNINHTAFVYQNESDKQQNNHYLQVALKGEGMNKNGIGAKVVIKTKAGKQYLEQMPTRGYQSNVSFVLHFGIGNETLVDTLTVTWPNGKQQPLTNIVADQLITLEESAANEKIKNSSPTPPIFQQVKSPIAFQHKKNNINDFKRQPLLINPLSFGGPSLAKADVNGDGLEDIYVGGSSGQSGKLFIQQKNGQFTQKKLLAFETELLSEEVNATFFDANGDGFPDLYVCNGGYGNFTADDPALQDHLFINDGTGNFKEATDALPTMLTSSSCVKAADINGDGALDLFVGSRAIPGQYPKAPDSYVLINDGNGKFSDKTNELASALRQPGLVTDAAWVDLNQDDQPDLVVVGEWMPVSVFINESGKLVNKTSDYFEKEYKGWWNTVLVDDLNQDGKPDLLVGNMGLNTQCKATDQQPAELFYKDFDDNGSIDPIFCFYIQGKSYPSVMRDELLDQMSSMRTRFSNYKSYADAQMKDIFSKEEQDGMGHLEANELQTTYFASSANGNFVVQELPLPVQYSPIFTITPLDFNQDGNKDLLLCGNINQARLRFGKSDANFGVLLQGNGKGDFNYVPQNQSGFSLWGDVRSVTAIGNTLLFGINQSEIQAYKLNTRWKENLSLR